MDYLKSNIKHYSFGKCHPRIKPVGSLIYNKDDCTFYLSSGKCWIKVHNEQMKFFDYVVCGSGPSGSVIASKLSKRCFNVALLEAGDDYDNDSNITDPTKSGDLEGPLYYKYFWQWQAAENETLDNIPDPYTGNLTLDPGKYTTGRLLGGGTSINGMQFVYPSTNVLRKWEEIAQDSDWGPDNVHKIINKLEKYNGQSCCNRGTTGKVNVRQAPADSLSQNAINLVEAIQTGLHFNPIPCDDYNCPTTDNNLYGPFYRWQLTQQPDGNRESSSTAFLNDNKNLKIYIKATVLNIIWNKKRAIGYTIVQNGIFYLFIAKHKTILSAGVATPKILQQSGVGDKKLLKEHGLGVIQNLPDVGNNVANHLVAIQSFYIDRCIPVTSDINSLYAAGAFLPLNINGESPDKVRDVQIIGIDGPLCDNDSNKLTDVEKIGIDGANIKKINELGDVKNMHRLLKEQSSYYGKLKVINNLNNKLVAQKTNIFILAELDQHLSSRGHVVIQNNDPLNAPKAVMNYLTTQSDVNRIKWMLINYVKPIADQLLTKGYTMLDMVDGVPLYEILSNPVNDDLLEQYIFTTFGHAHHWQGQCAIGKVVNSAGEVYNVSNLIVADTTIIPYTVDGNTSAPAYIIGSIIADKILKKSLIFNIED